MMLNTWIKRLLIILGVMITSIALAADYPMNDVAKEGIEAYQAKDYPKAFKLLSKASVAGNPYASEMLSEMYYNGNGVQQDYSKAYNLVQKAVDEGYVKANYALGQMYYFGNGVAEDKQKAIEFYTKAANAGYAVAQSALGAVYAGGKKAGIKQQNMVLSYQWYHIAWINGNDKNKAEFLKLFEQGKRELPYCIALGQDNVGQAYYQGIGGLDKSTSEALDWMQKAAETDPNLGVVDLDLAKMYHINGDDDKAFEAAKKAVASPYAPAMQYLGTMYQQGIGTDKDPIKAYAYLSLAIDLYKNPDTEFYSKYAAPCMPNYQQTTKEFNESVAQDQLDQISLNDQQKEQANKLVEQVKSKFK